MNGDTKTEPNAPITRQGWGDKTVTYDTYWINHGTTGDDAMPGTTVGPMLQAGTHFELWTKNAGRKLWELINCRQGNLFPNTNASGTTGLEAIKNYLPYSTKATAANNNRSMERRYAGNIVFRNTPEAQVVSSCYTNGIGTIYVDAVNGFTGSPEFTDNEIAIEVAYGVWKVDPNGNVISKNFPDDLELDADGNPVPPDDEHCHEVIRHTDDDFTTNLYERCAWVKATITGKRHEGGTTTTVSPTDGVKLNITTGQTMNNFYRLWAPVQDPMLNPVLAPHCNGPMRFRIKRVDDPTGYKSSRSKIVIKTTDLDGKEPADGQKYNALILLDNVIASLPAMKAGAVAKGEYVASAKKRNTVGWTGALSVKYPAIGEEGVKASAGVFAVSNNPPAQVGDPIDFNPVNWMKRATMKYRWRYFGRIVPEWDDPDRAGEFILDTKTADGLESSEAKTMPNLVGDVEFYYSAELDAPYYSYVDYSGSTTISGTPGYRERIKEVQTRLDPKKIGTEGIPDPLPSGGTNFFFRLREGKSDQLGYVLEMRKKGTTEPVTKVDFTLTGTRAWRAYYQTLTNETENSAEMEFRIVGENPAHVWGEKGAEKRVEEIPWSGHRLMTNDVATAKWTSITVDALTGYLMFQLAEDDVDVETMGEMSYTVVHADFQDFTHWGADATKGYFVGTYEDTTRRSGDSPTARDYPEDLAGWSARRSTHSDWKESFVDSSTTGWQPDMGFGGYRAYVSFSSVGTPNGWESGPGQWVCGKFHDSATGGDMALQMMGQGFGSLVYQDTSNPPNGLDTVSFKARAANYFGFNDFAFYNGVSIADTKNYLFTATVTMANKNVAEDNFDGNGTVSLTAYHVPNVGCYEVRAERTQSDRVRIWLYKWAFSGGQITATPLGYYRADVNNGDPNYTSGSYMQGSNNGGAGDTYAEMFIYCRTVSSSEVEVYAGVAVGGAKIGAGSGKQHFCVKYVDKSSPYTSGTYGFGTSGCHGRIINPLYYTSAPTFSTVTWTSRTKYPGFSDAAPTVTFNGDADPRFVPSTESFYIYKNWAMNPGAFEIAPIDTYRGVRAKAPSNVVMVEALPAGSGKWTEIGRTNVESFAYQTFKVPLRSRVKSSVRFRTGGDVFSPRTDVVIDDIEMTQWCAANFNDGDISDFTHDPLLRSGCPTNFVYVNGWVNVSGEAHTVDLQPTRAQAGVAMGVRGPLMDGEQFGDYICGTGLGAVSYTYENADPRCRLLVQWKKTNGSAQSLADDTKDPEGWTTIATNDFSTVDPEKLKGDTVPVYIGLRGAKGVLRIIVDPDVVKDANDAEKNPTKDLDYGKIMLKNLLFRDEPPMDDRCWWGWNLQARTNADELLIYDLDSTVQGRALALNNSVEKDISPDPAETELYKQHVPFVQSPKFFTNLVGEISFRVRKMEESDQDAQVTVLAAMNSEDDDQFWIPVYSEIVDSTVYKTCSWKAGPGADYAAFRVAVVGVEKVPVNYRDALKVPKPLRILIDDVAVSEAIRGKVGFFEVGAFRKPLDKNEYVPNLFDVAQQPMCEESWSVQCEVRATQLEEEIRLDDTTEVWLHWYRGSKWGYAKWADDPTAKKAKLARIADQPGFFFRGSYPEAPGAVVEPVYDSGAVVQFMLDVVYETSAGNVVTQFLSSAEWTKPAWYRGVDYNATRGGFAAYTILDTVAYGYAWINEVNVYDGPGLYEDKRTNQFVEVAVPSEANIKGWKLQFVTGGLSDGAEFYTNTVATFTDTKVVPDGVPCEKTKNMDPVSKYVFITAGNPKSVTAKTKEDGFIDGAWHVNAGEPRGQQLTEDGLIDVGMPIGIRLVRPSGIVEHEIVVAGTNRYSTYRDPYPRTYSATNMVARLNAGDPSGPWYTPWCEDRGTNATLAIGVTNFVGAIGDPGDWAHLRKTPGRINVGEYIPYDPERKPQGSMFVLYAQLSDGSLEQTIGSYERTTENLVLYVPKGLPNGTNITYDVAAWHEIASVTETEAEKGRKQSLGPFPGENHVVVTIGRYASNDVTVVATSRVREDLATRYGLTKENPYTPAAVAWLEKGTWGKDQQAFADQGGEIKLAKLHNLNDRPYGTDEYLSLTDMYWLDMDPTLGGIVLQSGFSAGPSVKHKTRPWTGGTTIDCEDMIATVKMFIRSENGDFETYAPYTLNGRVPGSTSRTDGLGSWDGPTFKITAHLNNGQDDQKDPDKVWMPVRYFYFGEGSFDENFEAEIQVVDPYYQFTDWYPWKLKGIPPPWYKFHLDDRKFGAISSELLLPDSTFPE